MIFIDTGQRSNKAIRPAFGLFIIALFWCGSFLIFSLNDEVSLLVRLAAATFLSSFLLIPGILLFQDYSIKVSTDSVVWESHVIPLFWKEAWKEPISNYSGIEVLHSIPIRKSWRYKPSTLNFPLKRFRGDRNSESLMNEIEAHNKTKFLIVLLKHKNNPARNVALEHFEADDLDRIQSLCDSLCQKLKLKPLFSFEHPL